MRMTIERLTFKSGDLEDVGEEDDQQEAAEDAAACGDRDGAKKIVQTGHMFGGAFHGISHL